MSRRIPQIESTLKRAVAQVLQRHIADPRIVGLVSITQIKISPDLHKASIYVSVLPEAHQRKTLAGLQHAAGHIHTLTCKLVRMRAVPRFDFRLDQTLKKRAAVHEAIQQGLQRTDQPAGDQPTTSDSPPLDATKDQAS